MVVHDSLVVGEPGCISSDWTVARKKDVTIEILGKMELKNKTITIIGAYNAPH